MAEIQQLHPSKKLTSLPHDNQIETQETLFFDIVSVDTLFLLVKCLSDAPHSGQWLQEFRPNDVKTICQVSGAVSAVSREMFKSLDHGTIGNGSALERQLLTTFLAPNLEVLNAFEPEFRGFNYELLRSLRVLRIAGCEDVSSLERILTASAGSLIELDIYHSSIPERMVRSITRHCKSLKVLGMQYNDYPASLEPIWSVIGSTLIEVRGDVPASEMVHVARHCKHIEKLNIWYLQKLRLAVGDAVSDLMVVLKSLRTLDLDWINLWEFSADELRMLLDLCPSDIHVYMSDFTGHHTAFANCVGVIGTRLRKLNFNYECGPVPIDALSAFANIEEMKLCSSDDEDVPLEVCSVLESIFVEPMPNLHNLNITEVKNSKTLAILARSLSNLREFNCSFQSVFDEDQECIPVKGSDFTELLQANKHLCRIDLHFGPFQDFQAARNEIADLIPRLKVCNNLNHVTMRYTAKDGSTRRHIARYEEISDACVALRTKSLYLAVNSLRYLPS